MVKVSENFNLTKTTSFSSKTKSSKENLSNYATSELLKKERYLDINIANFTDENFHFPECQ